MKNFNEFQNILFAEPVNNLLEQVSYIHKVFRNVVYMGSHPEIFLKNLPVSKYRKLNTITKNRCLAGKPDFMGHRTRPTEQFSIKNTK